MSLWAPQCFTSNLRPARRNHPVNRVAQDSRMTQSAHLAAWLFGTAVAVVTVGTLAVVSMADVGAEILLAVVAAVAPL